MTDAALAFLNIQRTGSVFVSRGDDSGTCQREKSLWQKAGIKPAGPWYLEVGQGMGAVLTVADEKQGYTISDRATYLTRKNPPRLKVLVEGDPFLVNYYSAIQVNPVRFPSIKADLSRQLIDWLCSPEGQKRIGDFSAGGPTLFKPACEAGK